MTEKNKTTDSEKKEIKKLEDYKTMGENAKTEEKPAVGEVKEIIEKAGKEKKKENKKVKEVKIELEREYVVPLRKKVQKVPRYKRAKKAIRVLKEFLAKHMKVEERDLRKIKIDRYLNQEIWFRGIKKPPARIKVKAIKDSEGIVRVELVDIPEKVKWDIEKDRKKEQAVEKTKVRKEKPIEKPKTETEEKEKEEKEKASVEAGLKQQKQQAKEVRHTSQGKHAKTTSPIRKALKK